ncbi:DUF58 domain-containing protein [uncultured Corynebacterium sp.]|uniref:DUF58 domain-containing protein n=1 Tax=uncultured Corynebacterium sp. TaxID=159447 RepID=UPI0025DA6785|nr:DUF58 domain-containing protein [uncultured Corynebacterium sp.]
MALPPGKRTAGRPPVALTGRGWGVLVCAVLAGILWRVLELRDLRYLMVLPLAMLLLALGYALLVPPAARLGTRVEVPDVTPTVGGGVDCVTSVVQRLPLRLHTRMLWQFGDREVTRDAPVARTPVVSRVRFRADRRGVQWTGVSDLVLPDPSGLVVRRIRVDTGRDLLVLPRPLDDLPADIPGPVAARAGGDDDAGVDYSAVSGVPAGVLREFRTGDAVRQVHWKQSARLGKLLVNQYETPERREAAVHLVADPGCYSSAESFETAVSATVTVADRLLEDDYRVLLSCGDGPAQICGDGDAVRRVLALVTTADDGGAGDPVRPADVVVTGAVTPGLTDRLGGDAFAGELLAVETLREAHR